MTKAQQQNFAKARKLMGRALAKDEGLRQGYISNVAVKLMDLQASYFPARIDFENKICRENAATELLRLIFYK